MLVLKDQTYRKLEDMFVMLKLYLKNRLWVKIKVTMCYSSMVNAPKWNIENGILLKLEKKIWRYFSMPVAQLQIMIIFVEKKAILKF